MSKSSEEIKELQRLVNRIVSLEGTLILFANAAYLVSIEKILDPEIILQCLTESQSLSEAEYVNVLHRSFSMQAPPRHVSTTWLASAQHDLKRLEEFPGLLALAQENPKLFKGQSIDRAWVAHFRQRLDQLRGLDLSVPSSNPFQLLSSLHGEEAAQSIAAFIEECVQRRSTSSKKAARRIELLALHLEGKPSLREEHEYAALFEELAAQALETLKLPGRARRKKLWQLVESLYFWPEPPKKQVNEEASLPVSNHVPEAIREIAARLVAAQPRVNAVQYRAQLTRVLLGYAVLFPPKKSLRIDEVQLSLLQRRWRPAQKSLSAFSLSFEEATAIVSLPYKSKNTWSDENTRLGNEFTIVGKWVTEGLSIEALQEAAQKQLLGEMIDRDWSTKTAQSYCKWVLQLAPHYQQQGIKLAISAETFEQLQRAKNEELALLAQCLLAHHAVNSERAAKQQIATLDATIALFQKLPQRVRDCLKNLEETPPTLGQSLYPEFAAWLGESNGLNRYLHLCALLKEPQSLSHSLLEDFSRENRRQKELQYLQGLTEPSELQQKMLARLSQTEEPISPSRTIRRLEERINELLQKIYRVRLDEIIAESFLRAYGLAIKKVTPAWRDIFRFYMCIEENRDLLGVLLQKATEKPRLFFVPQLPKNQEWLENAAAHLDVKAWLMPRRKEVKVGDKEYTLQLEEDPIEVLRMGVPFDTCLSLNDGANSASTVLNALDINKRVIYLKDPKGALVGRQLIAISPQYRLLRYRVYCSLEKSLEPLVEQLFSTFTDELAAETKLIKTSTGAPEKIHEGFWYDDGALPDSTVSEADVYTKQYCAMLGLKTPSDPPESLQEEAKAWFCMQEDKPEEAFTALRYWERSQVKTTVGAWLYQRLGHAECLRRALDNENLFLYIVLHCASLRGLRELLLVSRDVVKNSVGGERLYKIVMDLQLSPSELIAVIKEAHRIASISKDMYDHGLEHGLAYELPTYVSGLTLTQLFEVCDEVKPVWDWVSSEQEECIVCMESGEHQVIQQSLPVYLKDPDHKALLDCLQDKRRSVLSRQVALRLVALFPIARRNPPTYTPLSWFTRGVTDAPGVRNILKEMARDARFSQNPDLLAALLRHGATQEEIESLPLCGVTPFESLDNLILQISWLGSWLNKKYPSPNCEPGAWYPHLWELYFHRRFSTSWRKALRKEIETNGADAQKAAKFLCEIGDTDSIQKLQQNKELSKQAKGSNSQNFHWSWDPFLMTADVKWQLDPANQTFEDYLTRWSNQRIVSVDAGLLLQAIEYLQRAPKVFLDDYAPKPLQRAAEVIFRADVPDWIQTHTLEWLIERYQEELPESILNNFRDRLMERHSLLKSISPRLLLRLWGYSLMQGAMLQAMSKMYRSCDVKRLWLALQKEASVQKMDCREFIYRWLAAVVTGRCCDELTSIYPKEFLLEVMRAVLLYCDMKVWLDFYGELQDAFAATWFLQELQTLQEPRYEEILPLVADLSNETWEEKSMRLEWLRNVCQAQMSVKNPSSTVGIASDDG
jgi:hypothetical protein